MIYIILEHISSSESSLDLKITYIYFTLYLIFIK
jgi:hypothetical protein